MLIGKKLFLVGFIGKKEKKKRKDSFNLTPSFPSFHSTLTFFDDKEQGLQGFFMSCL